MRPRTPARRRPRAPAGTPRDARARRSAPCRDRRRHRSGHRGADRAQVLLQFQVLDQNGVGQLVRMATEKGRAIRPDLKCGICGEHGGEPSSVKFCHRVGLNYVSCSPFRVPIARLAAAQAAIEG